MQNRTNGHNSCQGNFPCRFNFKATDLTQRTYVHIHIYVYFIYIPTVIYTYVYIAFFLQHTIVQQFMLYATSNTTDDNICICVSSRVTKKKKKNNETVDVVLGRKSFLYQKLIFESHEKRKQFLSHF